MMNEDVHFNSHEEAARFWKNKACEYKAGLEETREELQEFQVSSRELENELETQLEQSEARCSDLRLQLNRLAFENEALKDKYDKQQKGFHDQIVALEEELEEIKKINNDLAKYVRELEQSNDDLERAKRVMLTSLEDFEQRLNVAIERNAFLESELDEKESLKEMVQRLKDEARDLRHEVNVKERAPLKHDNDRLAHQKRYSNQNNVLNNQIMDSNRLISNTSGLSHAPSKAYMIHGLNQTNAAMMPSSRISALNIVGDLLRKVGALESRLASCHTMVKEGQRPLPAENAAR